jgi:hypothetical protein
MRLACTRCKEASTGPTHGATFGATRGSTNGQGAGTGSLHWGLSEDALQVLDAEHAWLRVARLGERGDGACGFKPSCGTSARVDEHVRRDRMHTYFHEAEPQLQQRFHRLTVLVKSGGEACNQSRRHSCQNTAGCAVVVQLPGNRPMGFLNSLFHSLRRRTCGSSRLSSGNRPYLADRMPTRCAVSASSRRTSGPEALANVNWVATSVVL